MAATRQRRTPRLAVGLPIRVFAIDFKGTDFVEDSTTVVVNFHGAKIRLVRQLVPEQEIRIFSQKTEEEEVFRVVARTGQMDNRQTFWGVESLNPTHNIWGISFPRLGPKDQKLVRATLQCPACRVREVLYLDEPILESIEELGGLLRGCLACGRTGVWQRVPFIESWP